MCPAKALSIVDGRVEIDQKQCLGYGPDCGQACVKACVRKILRPIALAAGPVQEAPAAEKETSNEAKETAHAQ